MGLRFSPNNSSGGSLRFSTNQPGLMSSVYTVTYTNISDVPAMLTGLGVLTDPGADRILFWDESSNQITWLTVGSGLTLSGTTLTAAGGTVNGPVSSTDNAVVRFNGAAGDTIQNSTVLIDDSGNISPATTDVGGLGTSLLNWSDLFLDSGAVINFDGGDVTITHAANALAFANASNGYSFDAAVKPSANDSAALGTATVSWSDLFLATDGVISWNNGGATITQFNSSDHLYFQSASGGYYFDAVVGPITDDGATLGNTSSKWSDLFLASGGVINFNSGDVTVTHSSNTLAFAGASSGYSLDALLDISGAAAGQIKFPATQNPSSDVNTLDDYEEGTWTPVLTFGTPGNLSVTYATQVGSYTKIGNIVRVTCNIQTSAFTHTTASGLLTITGLPFTSANVTGNLFGAMAAMSGWTKANYTETLFFLASNSSSVVFGAYGSGQAEANLTAADMPTGGTVIIRSVLVYQV